MIKVVLKRAVNPRRLWTAAMLQSRKKNSARAYNDPQLTLIAKICPGDFLNYGFFEDAELQPADISVNDILRAQTRNAEKIVEVIDETDSPVLDVGCGLGGIIGLLLAKGIDPLALSPNRFQIKQIRKTFPDVELIEAKLEDLPVDDYSQRFGAVITSESLQYLQLDRALPVFEQSLRPGGKWIACDWFRIGTGGDKCGHVWGDFEWKLAEHGWRIVHQEDNTLNVVPLLRYIYMLANRSRNFLLKNCATCITSLRMRSKN